MELEISEANVQYVNGLVTLSWLQADLVGQKQTQSTWVVGGYHHLHVVLLLSHAQMPVWGHCSPSCLG